MVKSLVRSVAKVADVPKMVADKTVFKVTKRVPIVGKPVTRLTRTVLKIPGDLVRSLNTTPVKRKSSKKRKTRRR